MGRSKGRKPLKPASKTGNSSNTPRVGVLPWVRKPAVWIGTIVLTALATGISGWLQPIISGAIGAITATGEPLHVTYSLQRAGPNMDISLPTDGSLSSEDLKHLNEIAVADQTKWLEEAKGGVPLAPPKMTLTLRSNRTHLVRVTDLRTVSQCEEPSRGTLIVMTPPGIGTTAESEVFYFDVSRPDMGAEALNGKTGKMEPFFPGKTMTLTGDEEEFLVLEPLLSKNQLCHVNVELTVLDGDKEVRQLISFGGQGLPVLGPGGPSYAHVYLGRGLCPRVVPAKAGYQSYLAKFDFESACGRDEVRR
jgi:hypothetical protein